FIPPPLARHVRLPVARGGPAGGFDGRRLRGDHAAGRRPLAVRHQPRLAGGGRRGRRDLSVHARRSPRRTDAADRVSRRRPTRVTLSSVGRQALPAHGPYPRTRSGSTRITQPAGGESPRGNFVPAPT